MGLTVDDLEQARLVKGSAFRISASFTLSDSSPGELWITPTTSSLAIVLGSATIGKHWTIHNRGVHNLEITAGVGTVAAETLPVLYAGGTITCTLTVDGWRTSGGTAVATDEIGVTGLYSTGSFTIPTGRYLIMADNIHLGSSDAVTLEGTSTLVIL